MRKTPVTLVLLVSALLLFSACSSNNPNSSGSPFIGGSKALELSLISGAPPKEIFDNKQGSFQVTVQVKNSGEADLDSNDGYIQLEGIAPQEYGVSSAEFKQDIPAIKGARKTGSSTVINGNQALVTFGPLTYQRDINGNIASNKIIATACYNYMTKATSTVCIKQDGIDDPAKKNSVCTIESTKSVANSAGPVQVLSIKQIPLGDQKIQVQLEIGKVGTGTNELFFKKGTDCEDKQTNFDKYKVYVDVKPIVNELYRASCTGWQEGSGSSGYITLFDGAARQLQCTFDTGNTDIDAQAAIDVELEYRYMQQVETSILIKDVSSGNR